MLISQLHQWLISAKPTRWQLLFWLSLSLTFAAIYGGLGLQQAFSGEYVVQDDARQHIFWMQRFVDPELFPRDLIANYFESIAPWGYARFYQGFATVGVHPFLLNKLLPIALGLLTTGFCFGVSLQILPIPAAGFISTLLLNQNLWMKDDLISATPRAFLYPLFLAFLYYLLRRSLWPCLIAIALQGLFYPQILLITAGTLILTLVSWQSGRLRFSRDRQDYIFCGAGLVVAFLVLLPFVLQTSEFGPVITAAEARTLPEFWEHGRTRFFVDSPWEFWLTGDRSGIFPALWNPPLLVLGLLFPVLSRYPQRFPVFQQVQPTAQRLGQILVASLGLFVIAHGLLFKLQLPSRYTQHSFRIIFAIAAGVTILALVDVLLRWAAQPRLGKQLVAIAGIVMVGVGLICYPNYERYFPSTKYKFGQAPELYTFLQQTPKDSLIASISEEANFLPSFAHRSILVSREYAIPFHTGYYRELRRRVMALIEAQYSPSPKVLSDFVQKYGIDFWLLDQTAFAPSYLATNRWLQQFQPTTQAAQQQLAGGTVPALMQVIPGCTVWQTGTLQLLDASCVSQHLPTQGHNSARP